MTDLKERLQAQTEQEEFDFFVELLSGRFPETGNKPHLIGIAKTYSEWSPKHLRSTQIDVFAEFKHFQETGKFDLLTTAELAEKKEETKKEEEAKEKKESEIPMMEKFENISFSEKVQNGFRITFATIFGLLFLLMVGATGWDTKSDVEAKKAAAVVFTKNINGLYSSENEAKKEMWFMTTRDSLVLADSINVMSKTPNISFSRSDSARFFLAADYLFSTDSTTQVNKKRAAEWKEQKLVSTKTFAEWWKSIHVYKWLLIGLLIAFAMVISQDTGFFITCCVGVVFTAIAFIRKIIVLKLVLPVAKLLARTKVIKIVGWPGYMVLLAASHILRLVGDIPLRTFFGGKIKIGKTFIDLYYPKKSSKWDFLRLWAWCEWKAPKVPPWLSDQRGVEVVDIMD